MYAVMGITGKVGGAVARTLLARGEKVRGIVRNPEKATVLCFVLGLSFIFSFISYPSCIIIIFRTFISCPRFALNLCLFVTKRGRIYSREYTGEFCHFYMTLVHILRGKIFISHAHL